MFTVAKAVEPDQILMKSKWLLAVKLAEPMHELAQPDGNTSNVALILRVATLSPPCPNATRQGSVPRPKTLPESPIDNAAR